MSKLIPSSILCHDNKSALPPEFELPSEPVRSIALVSLHTCPWECAGTAHAGGMNVYVKETALEFARRGWQVDVFTRAHPASAGGETACLAPPGETGIELVHLPAGPERAGKNELHRWTGEFSAAVIAWQQRSGRSYTAILSHYWLSGLAAIEVARQAGAPHLASFHTLARLKQHYFPPEIAQSERLEGEASVMARADLLVANGSHEQQALERFYAVDSARIVTASPATDPGLFRPGDRLAARRKLGFPEDARIVLSVGRDTPIKGFDVLLDAIDRMHHTAITVLVGKRSDPACPAHGIRLPGAVPNENLRDYYLAADVCAVPSWYESFGMVALEALACGCPVVACRVGGLPFVVQDGINGLLVTAGAADELAAALDQVLSKPEAFDSAGRAAPSWASTTDQLETAIRSLG